MATIPEIIETVVRDRLNGSKIESIRVGSDVDSDGDPIITVTVIYDQTAAKPDNTRVLGMVRHLRSSLAEAHEDMFPLIRLISKSDADKSKYEAA